MAISYILIILFFLCYLSFWYSSLKIFKTTTQLSQKQRWLFKILTIGLWNYSLIALFFLPQQSLWGQRTLQLQKEVAWGVVFLLITALVLFWYARRTIKNVKFDVIFSQKVPEVIVKEGPYAFIRHPFYSSYVCTYLGLIVLNYNYLVSFLAFILIIDYFYAARNEEAKFLNSSFSEEYKAYQSRTKMFFPFIF